MFQRSSNGILVCYIDIHECCNLRSGLHEIPTMIGTFACHKERSLRVSNQGDKPDPYF